MWYVKVFGMNRVVDFIRIYMSNVCKEVNKDEG